MTDNTQEPDYTHPDEMPTVEHRPCLSSDLRGMIVHFTSEMLDNPNDYGIYPTTNFYSDLGEAILDWHNKQIEEVLDRLASGENYWHAEDDVDLVPLSAIEAERAKLKEVK